MAGSIAIATMAGQNQGNRLQNYALQAILEQMTGKHVDTLRVSYGPSWQNKIVKKALFRVMSKKRWARFEAFNHEYINQSKWVMNDPKLNGSTYELYIIGSDQVWNPTFKFTGDAEYLPQVPKEKKCSYAASFGVSEIVTGREHTAALLSGIGHISVREDAAKSIVSELCGVDAKIVLDPTMLLSASDWGNVAKKPNMDIPECGYILKYVLGDNVTDERARHISGLDNYPIIDLKDHSLPVGPAEFVWLILHATYVCTDSFHASVFSILMHIPFAIFERVSADKDMSSRFDTLCAIFGLENRRVREKSMICEEINWMTVEEKLAQARYQSIVFLKECVK